MKENHLGIDNPETPMPPEEAAQELWNYLNLNDSPEPAAAIFVLGGASLKSVEKAKELYDRGFAPKIAFISGTGTFSGSKEWGMPEAQKYHEELIEMGVPESAIVYQSDPQKQSTNTLNEAQEAIPFLNENGINPQKLILVSRPIHQRRAFLTFVQQHPEVEKFINCPADEPLNLNDPNQISFLISETERLLDYGVKKHDIQRPVIPYEILRAAATVRKYLKKSGAYPPRIKPSIE